MSAHAPAAGRGPYGLMAEFASPEAVLAAARAARREGYAKLDAYSPFPVEGLAEAVGFRRTLLPLLVLAGGIAGGVGGFLLQVWVHCVDYPLNIGGRPNFSWPAFVPVAFETTVLCAALAAVLGMLALNGLPEPYHPVFNVPQFQLASRDRFFLCVRSTDPRYDPARTRTFLERAGAEGVYEVEP